MGRFLLLLFAVIARSTGFPTDTTEVQSETNMTTAEQVPMYAPNATTLRTRYGEYYPDFGLINFQESKEVSSTIWDSHVEKIIARGVLQLALQLDYVLSSEQFIGQAEAVNIIFSPANIASALALLMLGAAGKTFTEITNVLGLVSGVNINANSNEIHNQFGKLLRKIQVYPTAESSTYTAMAGAVFVQEGYPIEDNFRRQIWEIYGSEVLSLDFLGHSNEAKDYVNRWVENRTYGRIPDILSYPPEPSTKVIIASALYFNGAWAYPFSPEQSKWKPFYIKRKDGSSENEVVQVIMMVNGADLPYHHDNDLGCQVVGLPYKDHSATMYLVLPDEPGVEALERMQARMTVNHLHQLAELAAERTVILAVPRMQLESTLHLKQALKALGVESLFDPQQADLSKISHGQAYDSNMAKSISQASEPNTSSGHWQANDDVHHSEKIEFRSNPNIHINPGLYAEDIIHKVTVDITEYGTEASAASAVSITRDGSHKVVRFERPFLFFIRHKATGVVLFWGTVIKPTPHQVVSVKS